MAFTHRAIRVTLPNPSPPSKDALPHGQKAVFRLDFFLVCRFFALPLASIRDYCRTDEIRIFKVLFKDMDLFIRESV